MKILPKLLHDQVKEQVTPGAFLFTACSLRWAESIFIYIYISVIFLPHDTFAQMLCCAKQFVLFKPGFFPATKTVYFLIWCETFEHAFWELCPIWGYFDFLLLFVWTHPSKGGGEASSTGALCIRFLYRSVSNNGEMTSKHNNNNNNRELIERIQKFKALYNWT